MCSKLRVSKGVSTTLEFAKVIFIAVHQNCMQPIHVFFQGGKKPTFSDSKTPIYNNSLSIFKLWSAHFLFIYFSYSRCSLFCGCRFMCIEEEKEEEMSSTAKDPPWS
jgi:hypothetical protein